MDNIWEQSQKVRLKQAMKMWSCIYKNQINQKILSSDQIQHFLPWLWCFHDPHEHVILNSIEESYNRLMRSCFLWFGPSKNLQQHLVGKSIVFLQKQQQLLLFYKQRSQYLQVVHIFSCKDQEMWEAIKTLKEHVKVQYHKITEPCEESIEKIFEQIGNNYSLQFPSFSQISVQQNKKINNERFWMYSVFNGINFKKSYKQFMQFLKYFIDNQPEYHRDKLMKFYNQCEQDSAFHDPMKYLRFYTGQLGLYRFINMCLRSWSDSRDLGHIRFPFLQIFIAIKMLQNQQKHAFIQSSKAGLGLNSPIICYRASGIKIKQLLSMKKGNLIQMTGFLSTSKSQHIANTFFKSDVQANVLFVIKIPQMERSFNIYHSFCQLNGINSQYCENQILVAPLNTFEVDKVEISTYHQQLLEQYKQSIKLKGNRQGRNEIEVDNNTNTNKYSKVYLNYIDCENRLKQVKSKKQVDGKQKIFIENYKYQKDMFRLTRNPGELLWRLHNIQDALSYYTHQFQVFLSIEKKNIGKTSNVDLFQADKYLKQLIHPATVKRLYTQLKQILHQFEWFEDKDQNLTLIKNFICNHPYRNYCLFFYTAKVYHGMLFYEKGVVFLELCFLYMLFLYNRKASGVYIAASNYSVNLGRLDIYDISHDFMRRALKFADNNKIRVGLSNFTFLAIHLINCQQTSTNQSIQDDYIRIVKQIMLRQQTCKNKDHAWFKFIENLGDIKQISKFKQYYNTNYGPPPIFLIFVCVYELKMSLLRNQIYHFGDDRNQQQRIVLMDELKVAKKCLDSFGKQQLKQISTLTKVLSQSVLLYQSDMDVQCFVDEWPDANQFGQDFTYYIFRTHVEALRYLFKLCRNVKKIPIKKCIRQLQTAIKLSRKFANNSYLNMMILLSLCEFCLACYAITGHPGYRNLCVPFLKLLVESRRRLRYIKQLDRLQTELMKVKVLAAFKKMGKQFKLTISETKTLTVSYASKLTITQPQ